METQNLWPDFAVEPLKSPKAILKEQASFLMEKTQNILSAEVDTSQANDGKITHSFFVVAPALDNYRYKIFHVSHSVIFYPMSLTWNGGMYGIDSEGAYVRMLKEIFNYPDTIRIIQSLMSQSMAE